MALGRTIHNLLPVLVGAALSGAALLSLPDAAKAVTYDCTSNDPAKWPPSSKPYFMIIVDTSGSMETNSVKDTNGNNIESSCGYGHLRIDHARCAVSNAIKAYDGQVDFGLATYASKLNSCNAGACKDFANPCQMTLLTNGCGPTGTDSGYGIHLGGYVVVPLQQDDYWDTSPVASNASTMLSYVDNDCGSNVEIGTNGGGNTPLGGSLFVMSQYFANTYKDPFTNSSVTSPLFLNGATTIKDSNGVVVGERGCRSVNVVLLTDGDESGCDQNVSPTPIANSNCAPSPATVYPGTNGERLAEYEADKLFTNGIAAGPNTFHVRTSVIGFSGATTAALDHIAKCGGTTASHIANNETDLSTALSTIIAGSVAPESCNNTDDNCNGCVDEGFAHYCNVGPSGYKCCAWSDTTSRNACLTAFQGTITSALPNGDVTKLPCTSVAQSQASATWLCYNPGDPCDEMDNNCNGTTDENQKKCQNSTSDNLNHCAKTEICDGLDDDCNGQVDEGGVCGSCKNPTAETCDGCDNDCDKIADNGAPSVACGQASPPNCAGQLVCKPAQAVSTPGGCVAGGGYLPCNNNPLQEVCDGLDNDCNGVIDDGIPSVTCLPNGTPNGLVYGAPSQCRQGQTACVGGTTECDGFIGPSSEICDGIDNDCNGKVDDNAFGTGQPCGVSGNGCSQGVTACVGGQLICQGGKQPSPEICDGIDNDCNGSIDDGVLADGPPAGKTGCWQDPPTCATPCVFKNVKWCPPPGATCNDVGTLTTPCEAGELKCVSGGWKCVGGTDPSPEVCDGIDNDCNGAKDDGNLPGTGAQCGTNKGECKFGTLTCSAGILSCVGGQGPVPETCDGLDNDCDGTVDNGIPTGGPCTMPYDANLYPGDRTKGACKPGVLECDGKGGTTCVGGVAPSPEVCDGIDNDCDGKIDETGAAPDGIDGTANPLAPPAANIGDACGVNQGVCTQGAYTCVNGLFQCTGGKQPQPESCDCQDNDCDGSIDNKNPNNAPPLCGAGKDCIKGSQGCQCAPKCAGGEFPCATGQTCEDVKDSNTGKDAGQYCITATCNDCPSQLVKDANGNAICGPAGTKGVGGCVDVPLCECHGQNGCQAPCEGVSCSSPLVCTNFGANAGKCVADNCFNVPCAVCGQLCDDTGSCKANPCPGNCKADEVCKPTDNFNSVDCEPTCAGVSCGSTSTCHDGQCVPTCSPACTGTDVCDTTQSPPACVPTKCGATPCDGSACCDPLTGACGACPCEGIVCPTDQVCANGECITDMGTGGAGGATSTSNTTSTGDTGATTGAQMGTGVTGSGGDGSVTSGGVFGLATGGGGCNCEVGEGAETSQKLGLLGTALALALSRARRRRGITKKGSNGTEVSK